METIKQSIFDFGIDEASVIPPKPIKPPPWLEENDFNSFIIKMYPYHKYELWFRDFLGYCVGEDRLIEDVLYCSLDLGTGYQDEDQTLLCSWSWSEMLTKEQEGWHKRQRNTLDYTLRDNGWDIIIKELQLPWTRDAIYKMTVREFYHKIKLYCREENYNG